MKEIRISPTAQLVVLLAVLVGALGSLVAMWPEIHRYIKIETM
jgi:hypothetical protein